MTFAIELDGHRALVTGAGQGVGRGIAGALAAAGAEVVVNDIEPGRAEAVATELRAAGGVATPLAFDVTDHGEVTEAVASLGRRVDILVNNAGNAGAEGFVLSPFAATAPADWERYFAVNLHGVLHCTHAVLPSMIASGWGRVITIISEAARSGEPGLAAYAAAKAGAAGFSRALAKEVGRQGITVNNVALGGIDHPARHTPEQEEHVATQLRRYVVRRFGTPEDVAGIVTFLASSRAEWITGQTLPVNGGYTLNQ